MIPRDIWTEISKSDFGALVLIFEVYAALFWFSLWFCNQYLVTEKRVVVVSWSLLRIQSQSAIDITWERLDNAPHPSALIELSIESEAAKEILGWNAIGRQPPATDPVFTAHGTNKRLDEAIVSFKTSSIKWVQQEVERSIIDADVTSTDFRRQFRNSWA